MHKKSYFVRLFGQPCRLDKIIKYTISASTSENWNTFLEPIMLDKEPYCNPNAENSNPIKGKGDCGNRTIGIMYFISFVIITFLIVVNMYIGKYKNVQLKI